MDKLDKWDIIAGLIGLAAWFRGEKSDATKSSGGKDSGQKVISILQAFVSKVDEGMWLSLFTQLNGREKDAITRLLKALDGVRERDAFRLTVVNAPVATTVVEVPDPSDKTGRKKIRKVVRVGEYSDQDTRVIFLKEIAELINSSAWGLEVTRDMLRTNEIATENKVAKHALEFWNKGVCGLFGVESLSEITPQMVARCVDVLARQVPYRRNVDVNPGFWRWAFQHRPTPAGILFSATVVVVVLFFVSIK